MSRSTSTERLAPLDALRGIAALGVSLFSHYSCMGGDRATYPFNNLLVGHWVYENAWLFVDLFFLLSGIVLTYRYLDPIANKTVGGRQFFDLRFSRLYPLHVVTLLICAAAQWTCLARHQPPVIYQKNYNDFYHFALQLTYLHAFFESGWSYNEPSWSVSGEVLVYLLFFLYARRDRSKYVPLAVAMVIVGIAAQSPGWNLPVLNALLGRALLGFFLGSLGYLAMRDLDRRGLGPVLGWGCLIALGAVCTVASLIGFHEFIGTDPRPMALGVFPLVIFASLRVPPLARLLSIRPLTFLGDISYAVYLIHIPMITVLMAVMQATKRTVPTQSPWTMFVFAAVLIPLATAVHYGFERPVRRWLRSREERFAVPSKEVAAA